MSVAKVIEISARSTESFEDAVRKGIKKASETVQGIQAAWIKEQQVDIQNDTITGYRVNMKVTFLIND